MVTLHACSCAGREQDVQPGGLWRRRTRSRQEDPPLLRRRHSVGNEAEGPGGRTSVRELRTGISVLQPMRT